jgi:hypothetical protein
MIAVLLENQTLKNLFHTLGNEHFPRGRQNPSFCPEICVAGVISDRRATARSLPFHLSSEDESLNLAKEKRVMLWTILAVILVLWLLGLIGNVGGSLIHLLLVVAVVIFLIQIITGRRTAV